MSIDKEDLYIGRKLFQKIEQMGKWKKCPKCGSENTTVINKQHENPRSLFFIYDKCKDCLHEVKGGEMNIPQ